MYKIICLAYISLGRNDFMKQIIPFKKEITFKTMISKITSISLEHTLELKDEYSIIGDFIVSGSYKMTEASQIDEEFSYKVPIEIAIDSKYDTSNITIDIDDFVYEVVDEEKLLLNIDLCLDNLELKQDKEVEEVETISSYDEYEELDQKVKEIEEDCKEEDKELVRMEEEEKELEVKNTRNDDLFLDTSKEETLEIPINIDSIHTSNQDMKMPVETIPSSISMTTSNIETPTASNGNEDSENCQDVSSIFSAFKDTDETFSTYCIYIMREGDSLDTVMNKYKTTRDVLAEYNDLSDIRIGTKIIIPSVNE